MEYLTEQQFYSLMISGGSGTHDVTIIDFSKSYFSGSSCAEVCRLGRQNSPNLHINLYVDGGYCTSGFGSFGFSTEGIIGQGVIDEIHINGADYFAFYPSGGTLRVLDINSINTISRSYGGFLYNTNPASSSYLYPFPNLEVIRLTGANFRVDYSPQPFSFINWTFNSSDHALRVIDIENVGLVGGSDLETSDYTGFLRLSVSSGISTIPLEEVTVKNISIIKKFESLNLSNSGYTRLNKVNTTGTSYKKVTLPNIPTEISLNSNLETLQVEKFNKDWAGLKNLSNLSTLLINKGSNITSLDLSGVKNGCEVTIKSCGTIPRTTGDLSKKIRFINTSGTLFDSLENINSDSKTTWDNALNVKNCKSEATNIDSFFTGYPRTVINFEAPNATSAQNIFANSNLTTIQNVSLPKVTNLAYGLRNTQLKTFDSTVISAPKATEISYLFQSCRLLETCDVSEFTEATTVNHLFESNAALHTITGLNLLTKINSLESMFVHCTSLETIDTSFFNGSIQSLWELFFGCKALKTLNWEDFKKLTGVTNASYAFRNCTSLSKIDVRSLQNITTADGMFEGCASIKSINLKYQGSINKASKMVKDCISLRNIECGTFLNNLASDANWTDMFANTSNLAFTNCTPDMKNKLTSTASTTKLDVASSSFINGPAVYTFYRIK